MTKPRREGGIAAARFRAQRLRAVGACAVPFFAVLFSAIALPASARWVSLDGGGRSRPVVTVLKSSPERILLDVRVSGFEADSIAVEGSIRYRIGLPGESRVMRRGDPEIPHICRSVLIPDRAHMTIRVVDAEYEELSGYPIAPSKGSLPRSVDPESVPFTFGPAYAVNDYYPVEIARGGSPYVLRDYRGLALEILPVQARPDGRLRIARRMRIEILSEGLDDVNVIRRAGPPGRIAADFAPVYRRHFINWPMGQNAPILEQGPMVVIADDSYHDAMIPFVNWKNQEGIPTTLVDVSTIGFGLGQIKSYIQGLYDTEGLAYVLLVGDNTQIAVPHAAGGASDATYSLVAGNDTYPDLFVGRFSAETVDQAATQVARTVAYESQPEAGAAWYGEGTGIGSDSGPGDDGEYDYQHIENIRAKLLDYGYSHVDPIYDPGATAAAVVSALNQGRGILNYCGRGEFDSWITSGFSSDDIEALQNDSMLPCIFSVACFNGDFENQTCFAETWMRSTRNGHPIGALATYMSSIDQLWTPPMDAQDAAVDLLIQGATRAFGTLCYTGSCRMMDDYGEDGAETFLTWILFGDPSVEIRTRTPSSLSVIHDGYLCPDQVSYSVLVPDVPGARCALYAGGVLYGSAIADSTGAAVIPLSPHPGLMTMTLTVTAPDRTPWVGQVTSAPILTAPAEEATCVPRSGTLDWNDVPGASGYHLQLGESREGDLILDIDVPPFSSYPYDSLAGDTEYYWRIAAEYPCGFRGPFSDWAKFRTEPAAPPAPVLLYPPNGATDLPGTGSLDWADLPDSVHYEIVIRCPSGRLVARDSTAASEYPYDLPHGTYAWNVRGVTSCGRAGAWGEESSFTIGPSGSCGAQPILESPPDSATCQGISGILRWQEISGAAGYVVAIGADSCGSGEEHAVSSPEYAYSDLAYGRTYHWRVREQCPCAEFSRCASFTTVGAVAAHPPRLESPPDGATDQPPSGRLAWDSPGPGVTGFSVQIGTACGEGTETVVGDSARFDYTDLEERTTYYWRVRARFDCDQWGLYSDCFSFQTGHPSSVGGGSAVSIPTSLILEPPVPNPVVGSSTIRFGLPAAGNVRLTLYDVSGREIAVIAQGERAAGWYSVLWNGRSRNGTPLAGGIYLARLVGPKGAKAQRMLLIP